MAHLLPSLRKPTHGRDSVRMLVSDELQRSHQTRRGGYRVPLMDVLCVVTDATTWSRKRTRRRTGVGERAGAVRRRRERAEATTCVAPTQLACWCPRHGHLARLCRQVGAAAQLGPYYTADVKTEAGGTVNETWDEDEQPRENELSARLPRTHVTSAVTST